MNGVVLYIDDNEDNVVLLRRLFKRKCPDVLLHTAMTGGDGVRVAIDGHPALILLDNRLPDASGAQVLRQLAATPVTAAIPVVIRQRRHQPGNRQRTPRSGRCGFPGQAVRGQPALGHHRPLPQLTGWVYRSWPGTGSANAARESGAGRKASGVAGVRSG